MNLKRTLVLMVALSVMIGLMMYGGGTRTHAAGPVCSVPGDHATIQGAVSDINCTTINVAAGTYNENVTIGRALTLNGAQAGNAVAGRTFGDASESTVNGTITINASGVTVNGFSLTKTAAAFGVFGIHIQAAGHGATISNNIFNTIISTDPGVNSSAQAVYLQGGPDNVRIEDNKINNIQSNGSAKGILIGDNGVANASVGTIIKGNSISNITSLKGAYGISVAKAGGTQHTGLEIRDNNIEDLSGGWAHAIGLEGDTPGAIVDGNTISDIVDLTPAPLNDAAAVFFEANPSFSTAEVHNNSFENVAFGITLHVTLVGSPGEVDGTCNWWGSADGPGPVGTGSGVGVGPQVDYTPWQTSPGGACVGPDGDGDGVTDSDDDCPGTPTGTQVNADGCPDADGDGIADANDNCPGVANGDQGDGDGDGVGNVCDTCPNDPANDADGDGLCADVDNCPTVANPDQDDDDADGLGNACDTCPNDPANDADGDGVCGDVDNCPSVANPLQGDFDGDGTGDACGDAPPISKGQCKNDGWMQWTTRFKNQGDCIQYVNTLK
jgi:hypothetical protein